jgi:nucleotide-binding universal stress UspA family protein
MFKNILIPIDGSPLANKAIKGAVQLAREQKARVTTLYVAAPYNPKVAEDIAVVHFLSPQSHADRAHVTARRYLKVVERAAAAAGVKCDSVVAFNDFPFEEIIRTAGRKKCDLICMASHGRRGISRLLLGSETNKVLAHSKVPVLVVR